MLHPFIEKGQKTICITVCTWYWCYSIYWSLATRLISRNMQTQWQIDIQTDRRMSKKNIKHLVDYIFTHSPVWFNFLRYIIIESNLHLIQILIRPTIGLFATYFRVVDNVKTVRKEKKSPFLFHKRYPHFNVQTDSFNMSLSFIRKSFYICPCTFRVINLAIKL